MTQPTTTPAHYEAMLADKIRDAIEEWTITDIPQDDESRASTVIIGKPTTELKQDIVISVHMRHPLGPSRDRDQNVTGTARGGMTNSPWHWPRETIGGMRTTEVTGDIQIRLRKKVAADVAGWIISAVKERCVQAINKDWRLNAFSDDFSNFVSIVEAYRNDGYDSGGGSTTIHIGWVDFRAYVHHTNVRET